MTKIRVIDLTQLAAVKTPRQLSPRQLALLRREREYEQAINKLQPGKALALEPTEEKLPTLRHSLARAIERNERRKDLHLAIIGGVAYVALEPIPGARRPGRKKAGAAST